MSEQGGKNLYTSRKV